jgi:ketosteroid isomerase-like protein
VVSRNEKLEFVRLVHEATGRRDPAGLELIDPNVEWDTSAYPFPDLANVYRGREGVAEFWRRWHAGWEIDEYEMEEFIDAGDDVVVGTRVSGRGRDGIQAEVRIHAVCEIRDGRLVRFRMYADREWALRAAGLKE